MQRPRGRRTLHIGSRARRLNLQEVGVRDTEVLKINNSEFSHGVAISPKTRLTHN